MTPKKKAPPQTAPEPETPAWLDDDFPVVGIGASAGGLAAFEAFFSALPDNAANQMAFVLVQHLSPDYKSILTGLIQRYTRMQVYEVVDGMEVKPGCTYIIPPNRDLALQGGRLHLFEPSAPRGLRLPIDYFFRSLAQDRGEHAICIVLSGTGSDGALGVRAVKGEGGMAMAQKPESAEHDGMPLSAIATGLIDTVLPPAEMPAQLIAYVAHAFGSKRHLVSPPTASHENALKKICVILRTQTGHDFSQYKETTLLRRVERRMALHQIERVDEYIRLLQRMPAEAEALFRDLLIGVTNFFRDPDAFEMLQNRVIPDLFAAKPAGGSVRIWCCGCSTGEEAYSLAILVQEHLQSLSQTYKVQIFATDIDKRAVDQARSGIFPASIAVDVPAKRLARFFTQEEEGGTYRINKTIRDLLIFSEQDVIKDPPFSRVDLISCRNLMIYLNPDLQRKLVPLFHYALNPAGVLFLGTSETVGEYVNLFATLDRKWKIYQRREETLSAPRPVLGTFILPAAEGQANPRRPAPAGRDEARLNLRSLTEQSLLDHYARTGLLVNARGDILYIYGRTGQYLEPAVGDAAGMNILAMAREGLRQELTLALRKAVVRKETVVCQELHVKTNGDYTLVNLAVRPAAPEPSGAAPDLFLVILEEAAPIVQPPAAPAAESPAPANNRITALEQELRSKEEYLQTTLEEMETANEELRSTNEEMQSVNEELQSTNEELETSKEELQSVNEELSTVNTELQTKVSELSRVNNDMNNLLAGTGVATIFVDLQLKIVRFTPSATQVINLIQTDLGRPVAHIVSNLMDYNRLVEDLRQVLDTLTPVEEEVQTKTGAWYLMRIRPYRTLENVIEGGVVTFVDITQRKRLERAVESSHLGLTETILSAAWEPILILDEKQLVLTANQSFYNHFHFTPETVLKKTVYSLADGRWDLPQLHRLLDEILPLNMVVDGYQVTGEFEPGIQSKLLLSVRRILSEPARPGMIVITFQAG